MTSLTVTGRDRWLLPLSGILLVMGGLLGVQVHTWRRYDPSQWGRDQTGQVLRSYQVQLDQQKAENVKIRTQLGRYEQEAAQGAGMPKLLAGQLQETKLSLGLVPAKGPGITLELGDSTTRVSEGTGDAELFVLHDSDLIMITNELWANGAEAIALNGQRLTVGSAIVCSGRVVQVNGEKAAAPFVFDVVGDPKTLISALNMPGGLLDTLRGLEFRVKLTPRDQVQVPPVTIAPRAKYLRPVLDQPATQTPE